MSSSPPKVVISEHLSDQPLRWLQARCEVMTCSQTNDGFPECLHDADGLIVRTYTKVDDRLLDQAPKLRVVGRAGVGLDNIALDACRKRGVEVVHTPGANTRAVAEYVLCLLCDCLRPRVRLTEAVDSQQWNRLRAETVAVRQFDELTLGILGFGRIGKRVAKIAESIGMSVICNDLLDMQPTDLQSAGSVEVESLFERADVLSVHIDGRASNRNFVDSGLIGRMKSDVVFINTSRGFVVDHEALTTFLTANTAAIAALDVFEPEPFPPDFPLLELPNAHLHPHLAGRTQKAMENMSWVVRDVWAALK